MPRSRLPLLLALVFPTLVGCTPGATSDRDRADDAGRDLPSEDEGEVAPSDGTWSGSGIRFTVSAGGTWVEVESADYGSCSNGGCSSSASATCGSCGAPIEDDLSFDEGAIGCWGTFTSPTTAEGGCGDWSDCGCSMSRSWTASLSGAASDDGGGSGDDPNGSGSGPDPCEAFLCNGLAWSDGSSLRAEFRCGEGWFDADSGECGDCVDVEPGTQECEVRFDGEAVGSFEAEFEEGGERGFALLLDGGEVSVLGADVPCGTDLLDQLGAR